MSVKPGMRVEVTCGRHKGRCGVVSAVFEADASGPGITHVEMTEPGGGAILEVLRLSPAILKELH